MVNGVAPGLYVSSCPSLLALYIKQFEFDVTNLEGT